MAFDGITIANIAQELNQTIVGGKINKIAQPEKREPDDYNKKQPYRLPSSPLGKCFASADLPDGQQ